MARPTSRKKSAVSLALTALREAVGDTQQQFAVRLGTTVVTIGRWETSHPPSGKTLERLLKLAKKHRHAESVQIFEAALGQETDWRKIERRIGQIRDRFNLKVANDVLGSLWGHAQQRLPTREPESLTEAIGLLTSYEFQLEQIRDAALRLADVIAIDGRRELLGEKLKTLESKRK
jgi:transcriptional regulator with XRE-family HTH domain